MDGAPTPSGSEVDGCLAALDAQTALVRSANAPVEDAAAAVEAIVRDLGPGPFALVALFVSSEGDFRSVARLSAQSFPGAAVIGCSTAGEISSAGYTDGEVVAIGLPAENFSAYVTVIEDVGSIDHRALASDLMSARAEQAAERPDWDYEFAFMTIDGLSRREDEVAAALSAALGPTPLFGGSAGDGRDFRETFVLAGGEVRRNAAVVSLIRTRCPIRIFKTDNMFPTEAKMVVTGADPERRIVTEINAEPAAREYARILGKDPDQLTPMFFAAHPVLVRIGGQHHVRSIQNVAENGDLNFFSAVGEGVVLTVAEPEDIALHLERTLSTLSTEAQPDAIIACDCLLRRAEAEQKQAGGAVSRILARHKVVGFNTYGEQMNGAHVNQTLTGVAIYPPTEA